MSQYPHKAQGAPEEEKDVAKARLPTLITHPISLGGDLIKVPPNGSSLGNDYGKMTTDECGDCEQAAPYEMISTTMDVSRLPRELSSSDATDAIQAHWTKIDPQSKREDSTISKQARHTIVDPICYPDSSDRDDSEVEDHPYSDRRPVYEQRKPTQEKGDDNSEGEGETVPVASEADVDHSESEAPESGEETTNRDRIYPHKLPHENGNAMDQLDCRTNYSTGKVSSHKQIPETKSCKGSGDDLTNDPPQEMRGYEIGNGSTSMSRRKRLDFPQELPRERSTPRRLLENPREKEIPPNRPSNKAVL